MQAEAAAKNDKADVAQVLAAVHAADNGRASELARAALDRGEVHPLFLNLRAWWHEKEGRVGAALADLKHAHALAPEDVPVLNALGLCLERAENRRDALKAFDSAVRLQPDFAPAWINRGRLCELLGDSAGARQSYETAIRLGRNAHAELAALATLNADWPTVRHHAASALAINPRLVSAEHSLAAAETAEGDCATATGRLERLLRNAALSPPDRATTLSLLGDALDAAGKYAEAFAAYEAGNALSREMFAARYADPRTETMRDYVERLARWFERLKPEDFAAAESDVQGNEEGARRHLFLLGFARSGTTLLEEALASHPDVVTTQERNGLAGTIAELLGTEAALDRLAALRGGGLARHRRAYWRTLSEFGINAKGKCLIDKQPYNTIALPLIAKLFPSAHIVFCLRDPRDVVLSCFRRRFMMSATNYQLLALDSTARFYDSVMRLADLYRRLLPLSLRDLRHEDLLADFDHETEAVCSFAGIPWSKAAREFAGRVKHRSITTPSGAQLTRGLDTTGAGQWRNYRDALAPVLPILAPWVERFGYPAD